MIFWRRKPLNFGRQGENIAAKALKRAGYTILERNAVFGRYEIDIIAREGDTIAFVEVKTRRSDDIADPEDNVTTEKVRHILRAAEYYIERNRDDSMYYRFDIVSVIWPERGKPKVTIYRDAFTGR